MFKKIKQIMKNPRYGMYPACDHLNCAIQFLLKNHDDNPFATENALAIEEILYAIIGSNGYLYESLKPELKKIGLDYFVRTIEEYENH